MQTEATIRKTLNEARAFALRGDASRGLTRAVVADTLLRWVLEEATLGEVAYVLSSGACGAPHGLTVMP